ncbi:MAG TPA: Fic family protein [Pyrinomonadaceae bacterium]|jgi:Fic family protein
MLELKSTRTGYLIERATVGESFYSFMPHRLPPKDFTLSQIHFDLLEKANRALGKLDSLSQLLPNVSLFIYWYVRKEAVLSSQIEGTQSSLSDLLLYEEKEVPSVPIEDVEEVSQYVAAVQYGLKRLNDGFPMSLRLIKEIHEVLLSTGRGSTKSPGDFRRSQNWIGGTRPGNARFVPPPPENILDLLSDLEKFLHDIPERTPTLIKAALSHVQFETIHPFLDGNGRLGRLLIILILCAENAIAAPTLYLSLYFKRHREIYYELLQTVRTEGKWEEWLEFFLEGVQITAEEAVSSASKILTVFAADRQKIEGLGRAAASALRIHELLQKKPIISVPMASKELNLSAPTVRNSIDKLKEIGLVKEITGKKRDRLFSYQSYLDILQAETEV